MLEYSHHLVHMPLPPFLTQLRRLPLLLEEQQLERVVQEISSVCVDTKPRGIKATCIVSGDRGRSRVSSRFQCEQQKPWQWPANKAIVICVYALLITVNDRAKPKAQ